MTKQTLESKGLLLKPDLKEIVLNVMSRLTKFYCFGKHIFFIIKKILFILACNVFFFKELSFNF